MHLPNSYARRLIGAAAIACVAALAMVAVSAATASPARHTGAAASAGAPSCATSGLVVWLDTYGNGTAGSIYYNLEFTNLSGHACTLFGYPGVSAVNLAGKQLGSAAIRNNVGPPGTVKLASGSSAIVVLRITDVDNFPSSVCHRVTAAGLRVYPPNQKKSELVPYPFGACSRSGPAYLSVEAVKKA
ncbi:MAG: DUF4232 domain-containing protein [Gaiellaceae bacterium]